MNKIIEAIAGSKSYGLDTPESDTDYHGVFLRPLKEEISLFIYRSIPDTWSDAGPNGDDHTYHELKKFLLLACKGSPFCAELLFTPKEDFTILTESGERVLDCRDKLLSKKYLTVYSHMIKQHAYDFEKFWLTNRAKSLKKAINAIRLAHQASELSLTKSMTLRLSKDFIDRCTEIRSDSLSKDEILFIINSSVGAFTVASNISILPDNPDYQAASDLLLDIRLNNV